MSLSKHALTFLKRHYRALLQRAYVLGRAATAWCRFSLIPAPHSAQPAPAYRRRPKLTVPMLVAITALTCGPGLETAAAARTEFTGDSLNGLYTQSLEIISAGTYNVADGTKFKGTFKNGEKNGPGILVDSEGQRYEGGFLNNEKDGAYVLKDKNGNIIEKGTYVRGVKRN